MNNKFYKLPELRYGFKDLEPYISHDQLSIHYQKHHKKYVDDANEILADLDEMKSEGLIEGIGCKLKKLSFNIGGHVLHSLFWRNLIPPEMDNKISEIFENKLDEDFGGLDYFKKAFGETALKIEGSGWAALAYCKQNDRLIPMQIEKHNVNIYPMFSIVMVLDVWEHAYYLDYKNERAKFIDAFWNIANWSEVSKRYEDLL